MATAAAATGGPACATSPVDPPASEDEALARSGVAEILANNFAAAQDSGQIVLGDKIGEGGCGQVVRLSFNSPERQQEVATIVPTGAGIVVKMLNEVRLPSFRVSLAFFWSCDGATTSALRSEKMFRAGSF